ncbi:MAG: N-acetylgalactosamine-6-sulfatase [Pirellulaceae bacterium]|nr:MAG: N-acetylgalactosamine-6-sulfatase [Pirellulaceae bacterium]
MARYGGWVWIGIVWWIAAILVGPAWAERPNVVVFLADDAGWGDYGVNGNRAAHTPNIDSLARDGAMFERFYVCPVCSPTRAEFLTGRYHPRSGVYGVSTGQERMDLQERTIAEAFQQAGYATGLFGKWHNGSQGPYHPNARGFDEFFGYTAGHWGQYFDPPLEHNGQPVRTKGYIVDVCTDQAIAFIERNQNKPFFCTITFTTPHSPWAVPDEYWQRYREKPIEQRATDPERENLDHTRCALAMLENQDWNVGRVLSKLDALGLRDKTIVFYFSDNGPNTHRWNGGMRGIKGSTDEGGLRSIAVMRWPQHIPAGRRIPGIAGAIDLLPTLISLASVPRVGNLPLDGMDWSAWLVSSDPPPPPERMLFSTWAGRVSVRTDRYRLDHQGRLYDMEQDPAQTRPINHEQPQVARRLFEAVEQWRRDVLPEGRPMLLPGNVDPRPLPVGYPLLRTWLPARDGQPYGNVRRSAPAPNSSFFTNWTSTEDRIVWKIDVLTEGTYSVELSYTCPEADVGSEIELEFQGERLRAIVAEAWDPPFYTNQDTLPRPPAESPMKEFRTWKVGTIRLSRGEGELTLRALRVPGRQVMELLEMYLVKEADK